MPRTYISYYKQVWSNFLELNKTNRRSIWPLWSKCYLLFSPVREVKECLSETPRMA